MNRRQILGGILGAPLAVLAAKLPAFEAVQVVDQWALTPIKWHDPPGGDVVEFLWAAGELPEGLTFDAETGILSMDPGLDSFDFRIHSETHGWGESLFIETA